MTVSKRSLSINPLVSLMSPIVLTYDTYELIIIVGVFGKVYSYICCLNRAVIHFLVMAAN